MSQDNNPPRSQPGWPAVVIGGGYQTAVNLARNLVRRGLKIYFIDNIREHQAFHSVYGKTFECPHPTLKPAEWRGFMLDLARKLGGKPVLIPTGDTFVLGMARDAEELKPAYIFCHDTVKLQGMLSTKERQYDLAVENGMPVPRTRFAKSPEEVVEFGQGARFPCLIKPVRSFDWARVPAGHPLSYRKIMHSTSVKELEANYSIVETVSPEVVVQEIIEGPDTAKLVYLSCYSSGSRRIAQCMFRELRTSPIYFGSASVVEPVADPETDSLCDGFLKRIGYGGLCEIELKRDSRDGQVKMIEANPRFTGTSDAAPYAGVDLGWLHYLDLIGQRVEMVSQSDRDFRHVVLSRDLSTLADYRQAGLLTWRDLIRSYRPPVAFFDFHLRDWRLAARTIASLAFIVVRGLSKRLFGVRRPS